MRLLPPIASGQVLASSAVRGSEDRLQLTWCKAETLFKVKKKVFDNESELPKEEPLQYAQGSTI